MLGPVAANSGAGHCRQFSNLRTGHVFAIASVHAGRRDKHVEGDALGAQEWGDGAECVDVAVIERKRDAVLVCGSKRNDGDVVFVRQLLNGFYLLRKLRVGHGVDAVDIAIYFIANRVIHEDAPALGVGQWCEAARGANKCCNLALGSEHPLILRASGFGRGEGHIVWAHLRVSARRFNGCTPWGKQAA